MACLSSPTTRIRPPGASAEAISEACEQAGLRSAAVHYKTPKDVRKRILQQHRDGELDAFVFFQNVADAPIEWRRQSCEVGRGRLGREQVEPQQWQQRRSHRPRHRW